MMFGENLERASKRIAKEYGMTFDDLYLVGVFPVAFSFRSDVTIALASPNALGDPYADGKEFSVLKWAKNAQRPVGGNYLRMINKWMKIRKSKKILTLNKVL